MGECARTWGEVKRVFADLPDDTPFVLDVVPHEDAGVTRILRMYDVVFLDMDGVAVDFVGAALKLHGSSLRPQDIVRYEIEKFLGITPEEFWRPVNEAGPEFWENLEAYPWYEDLYEGLRQIARHVVFVTSPAFGTRAAEGKVRWMINRYGRNFRGYILTSEKHYLAACPRSILIDDYEANYLAFREAGGRSLLFPAPWNSWRRVAPPHMPPEKMASNVLALCLQDDPGSVLGQFRNWLEENKPT